MSELKERVISEVINPYFLECIAFLKDMTVKIAAYNEANIQHADCISEACTEIDTNIYSIAYNLSELIRFDLMENTFYQSSKPLKQIDNGNETAPLHVRENEDGNN